MEEFVYIPHLILLFVYHQTDPGTVGWHNGSQEQK